MSVYAFDRDNIFTITTTDEVAESHNRYVTTHKMKYGDSCWVEETHEDYPNFDTVRRAFSRILQSMSETDMLPPEGSVVFHEKLVKVS